MSSMPKTIITTRVPPAVKSILATHAEDTGRTISVELELWAAFGAAAIVHSALHQAGVEPTPDVVEARAASASDMSYFLHALLPHSVEWPEEPALAAAAAMN